MQNKVRFAAKKNSEDDTDGMVNSLEEPPQPIEMRTEKGSTAAC